MKRKQLIIFVLDKSGSTAKRIGDTSVFEKEYKSVMETIQHLQKANENSLEMEYLIELITFDDHVHTINPTPLSPAELLQVLDSKAIGEPAGCTSIATLYHYLDQYLTRNEGGWLHGIGKGDPLPIVFLLTDYCATDSEDVLTAAASNLLQNNNYVHAKRLCLFLGDEEDKSDAEVMFGEDNVLNMELSKLDTLLTPVLATSSVVSADRSRVNAKPITNKDVMKEQEDIATRGKDSSDTWIEPEPQEELTDEELQAQIIKALGGLTA